MSATGICDIGYKQGAEFFTALEKAGFTRDLIQQVINSRGNRMAKTMYVAVTNGGYDDRFYFVKTIEVTVPADYVHDTRLDTFRAAYQNENKKEFYFFYDEAITDENYASIATTKLTPGRKFAVNIFGIKKGKVVSSPDCLAQLKRVGAVLTGAQGASLVYEQCKAELPKGNRYTSFDEKDALWRDSINYHRVPYFYVRSGIYIDFNLGYFESDWDEDDYLLAFCDLPDGEV